MSTPSVSVIMPAYNTERYIRAAVESILAQTYIDFEFIIVDDGSTDTTSHILAGYASQDSRIVLQRQTRNQGYTRALNLGLSLARGPLLARQDADDRSAPERLERQVAFLAANPAIGLVSCQVQVIGPDDEPLAGSGYDGGLDNQSIQRELLDHNVLCHGSALFRHSCLDQVGAYHESLELAEDYDLWLRLAEITQIIKLPETLYLYRRHPSSVSHVRRALQMVAQGHAQEAARQRRQSTGFAAPTLRTTAESFRMAASLFILDGEHEPACQQLTHALRLSPELFAEPDTFVPLPTVGTERDLAFLERALAGLPRTGPYNHLRRLLRGREHMRQAFAAARGRRWRALPQHLWRGLLADPSWLRNRGVWALAGQAALRGWRA